MSKRPRPRKEELPPCAEVRDDDQIDPRTYFDRRSAERGSDRRARMLCAQVRECLQLSLGADAEDERLLDLSVEDVVPAPDASRLRVRVRVRSGLSVKDAQSVLAHAAGRLRSEVAAEIQRRRVPELVFEVLAEDAP